jgi:hypothetical protein
LPIQAEGEHVSVTKPSAPSQAIGPVTDAITILGFAAGWVMIVVGLFFLGLTLTN